MYNRTMNVRQSADGKQRIRTLIVEDDLMLLRIYETLLWSAESFEIVRTTARGEDVMDHLFSGDIDLVILDLHLPGMEGIDVLRLVRSWGHPIDVICVSGEQSTGTIAEAARLGAFDYVLKPFTFERFRETLDAYRSYRLRVSTRCLAGCQDDADAIFRRTKQTSAPGSLPKGLQQTTLDLVTSALREALGPISPSDIAERLSLSRATVGRYLDFLTESGVARCEPEYGRTGRPVMRYRLLG